MPLKLLGSFMSLVLHAALPFIPDRMPCTWKHTGKGTWMTSWGIAYVWTENHLKLNSLNPTGY